MNFFLKKVYKKDLENSAIQQTIKRILLCQGILLLDLGDLKSTLPRDSGNDFRVPKIVSDNRRFSFIIKMNVV